MTWTETYNKYKDTKLMKALWLVTPPISLEKANIKDIWGYLICFAETKGITLEIMIHTNTDEWLTEILQKQDKGWKNIVIHLGLDVVKSHKSLEQAMLWCAEKFFEVCK